MACILRCSHSFINGPAKRSSLAKTHQRAAPAALLAPASHARSHHPSCFRTVFKKSSSRAAVFCEAVGIFYSTSTGHTEEVADIIKAELGDAAEGPFDIGDADLSSLAGYDGLIVGAPTWNTGSDTQRSGTAWDDALEKIKGLSLSGKKVGVFGLGDQASYSDYYCDAMEELYRAFEAAGASMAGHWPTEGYDHSESKAEIEPGKFCGLALDQDNQDDLTEARIKKWLQQLGKEGVPVGNIS